MPKAISQRIRDSARENAKALLEDLYAGNPTSQRLMRMEKDLKRGLTAEQLGLTDHEIGIIARHA